MPWSELHFVTGNCYSDHDTLMALSQFSLIYRVKVNQVDWFLFRYHICSQVRVSGRLSLTTRPMAVILGDRGKTATIRKKAYYNRLGRLSYYLQHRRVM